MVWNNGYISQGELTIFKRGYNSTDGNWFHGLTPATYARHLELVRIAQERTGRTLEISDGWGAYRPYDAQVVARRIYGNGAAVPGTSSHGGYWERRETMAMDYSNWGWVYSWDRAAFYADVRKTGLTPGMIEPSRGYPDEPWHVIDVNPRVMPSFAGSDAKPLPKPPTEEEQIMDVKNEIIDGVAKVVEDKKVRSDAIVWVNGSAFLVDDAGGTKWNVARGQRTIEDAFAFINWLRARGFTEYLNQPPYVLAGYRDVTEEGSVRDEVAKALRETPGYGK